MITRIVALCALLAFKATAAGQDIAVMPTPLSPDAVLLSSEAHFPSILKAIAERRAADAKSVEAQGAFDLVFESDGFGRLSGFYDGRALSGKVKQPLRRYGASIFSGYKISEGDFPIYEDVNFTNTGGTFNIGVLFSLLRDRDIDERRFQEADALLGIREAELELLLTKIGVQRRALMAYWTWVAHGRQLQIYRDLLMLTTERQDALARQVSSGARAEIFLTENLQNMTRRQSLVMSATRDLQLAANDLSFYYRDEQGRTLTPGTDQLPEAGGPMDALLVGTLPEQQETSAIVRRRPELQLIANTIERQRNRLALSENALKPRLDFQLEVQDGLGAIQDGGASRDTTDTIVGFSFSVPLQRRSEQGRLDRARAELDAQKQSQRLKEEQITLEVNNLLLDLNFSRQLLVMAEQEAALAEILRAAELRRFESGASDFFLVNIREETEANARIKLLEAELKIRIARVNYDAATVNLGRLGLSSER